MPKRKSRKIDTAPPPSTRILSAVAVSSLHLDPINPRRDPIEDENEIRRVLCEDEGVLQLARHMAEFGQNPLARIAIIDHPDLPGHYIVPEGNRRLCSMQLLRDPDRAPSAAARTIFGRLKTEGVSLPETVEAVWFDSRKSAAPWIHVNHGGEQGGIGTVDWGTPESTRFNRQTQGQGTHKKNPNIQALSLVEYATARNLITPEQARAISLTTVTRYLPSVRAALALENNVDATTRADQSQFDAGLLKFLQDAMPTGDPAQVSPVHSRSAASDRRAYAEQFRQGGFSPAMRTNAPYNPAQAAPAPQPAAKASTRRSATHPSRRKYLVMSDFVVPFKDPVLQRMVSEGKQHTDVEENRFGANYLTRAILEVVVDRYAKSHGVGSKDELGPKITAILQHAGKQPTPPSKGVARTLNMAGSSASAKYGYEVLSHGVHGGRIPTADENRSSWETLQPALQYLLNNMRVKNK